ncbi:hypothetical protein BRADI_4g06376v3 [Brachypodium distachyon]|uniref:Pre-rRNA-processing protein TSR2 n=1 Tax=Brachypodium distachyon TaxID=15368 RepID=A0A0Q3IK17_BRADI|nr:hypothetical protein BRADI_4g06376v3 [Brachypodium distachyon]
MSASTSGGGALSPQAAAALQEGIRLVFGRWTALQMAVENQSGGRDSRAKADQFAASILSWFSNSKGPFYFDDLANMMDNTISESFRADFFYDSVEESYRAELAARAAWDEARCASDDELEAYFDSIMNDSDRASEDGGSSFDFDEETDGDLTAQEERVVIDISPS